jgi:hypothetical protein
LRGASTGDKQVIRLDLMLPAQPARQFEANEATHAMTKECERPVQVGKDVTLEGIDNWFELCVWRFA